MTSDSSDPRGGFDWQRHEHELIEPSPVDSPAAQRPPRFTMVAHAEEFPAGTVPATLPAGEYILTDDGTGIRP